MFILAPTNLASRKVTHSTLEAYINHGGKLTEEDYDVLMLESRHAALFAAGKETSVIKPKPGDDQLIEKVKIKHHLRRLLEEIDGLENNPNTKHLVTEYLKGWNQDARNKIERYSKPEKMMHLQSSTKT